VVVILLNRFWSLDLFFSGTGAATGVSEVAMGGGTGTDGTAEVAGVIGIAFEGVAEISKGLAGPPTGGETGGMASPAVAETGSAVGLIFIGSAGAEGAGMEGATEISKGLAGPPTGGETGGMASPAVAETGPAAAGICLGTSNFFDGGRGSICFKPTTSPGLGLRVKTFGSHK